MSHISKIELVIKDLDALQRACTRLDLQFLNNKKMFSWYNGSHPCDHAIRVPNASYEVGVVRNKDNYELLWDDWSNGGLQQRLGTGAGLLKQAYAIERVRTEARRKNLHFTEQRQENGIRLTLSS